MSFSPRETLRGFARATDAIASRLVLHQYIVRHRPNQDNRLYTVKFLPLRNQEIWRSLMPLTSTKSLALILNFVNVRLNASL
ncbi:MAG: hypothetical protein HC836_47615 [Richelia sp. RM2_1_2]|nr:hypothetical protein [Richelia sp. RM2_1_2]